jgi:hypothetical protein
MNVYRFVEGNRKSGTITLVDIVVKFILINKNEPFCSHGGKLKK